MNHYASIKPLLLAANIGLSALLTTNASIASTAEPSLSPHTQLAWYHGYTYYHPYPHGYYHYGHMYPYPPHCTTQCSYYHGVKKCVKHCS